jgi:hypothetical protein
MYAFYHIEVADERIWHRPGGIECFAGDLSEAQPGGRSPAGTSLPRTTAPSIPSCSASWPRMGATTTEVDSSHVPMLSNPGLVIDVIRKAAAAVEKRERLASGAMPQRVIRSSLMTL